MQGCTGSLIIIQHHTLMIKRIILTCSFLVSAFLHVQPVYAQDILNAELNATPLAINPAFTGMFNGTVRASILYRNQWASTTVPYTTYGATVDLPVYMDGKGNYLATGVQLTKSLAGDANLSN